MLFGVLGVVETSVIEEDIPHLLSAPLLGFLRTVINMDDNTLTSNKFDKTVSMRVLPSQHRSVPVVGPAALPPELGAALMDKYPWLTLDMFNAEGGGGDGARGAGSDSEQGSATAARYKDEDGCDDRNDDDDDDCDADERNQDRRHSQTVDGRSRREDSERKDLHPECTQCQYCGRGQVVHSTGRTSSPPPLPWTRLQEWIDSQYRKPGRSKWFIKKGLYPTLCAIW